MARVFADEFVSGPLRALESVYPGVCADYERGLERDGEGLSATGDEGAAEAEIAEVHLRLVRDELRASLFDYQEDLAEQAVACFAAPPGSNMALLSLPTGAGKTRTALSAVLRFLGREGRSRSTVVLWLAGSRELLGQAATTAEHLWREDWRAPDMDLIRADRAARFELPRVVDRPTIVFMTPQMLSERIRVAESSRSVPELVVFDEAHHLGAPTFREAVERLRAIQGKQPPVLGLSATPGRSTEVETHSLVELFGGRLLRSRLLQPNAIKVLQRRGVLAQLKFQAVHVGEVADRADAPSAMMASGRLEALARLFSRRLRPGRALVFAGSIKHAHAIAAVLRMSGTTAEVVSANTDSDRRAFLLTSFAHDKLRALVSRSLLAAGYDSPGVRHVVLTVPVSSAILFEQIVGRAARGPLTGGVARSTIWEFDDHLALHGFPASYYRFADFDWS